MNHPCCFAPFFFPRPGAKETLQTLDVIRLPHRCGRLAVGPVVWQLVLDAAFVVSKFVEANWRPNVFSGYNGRGCSDFFGGILGSKMTK